MLKTSALASPSGAPRRLRFVLVTALAAPLYIATGVLILAGLAKVKRPSATAAALVELSIPAPLVSARLLGAAEVVLGVLAIALGSPVLWAGVALSYGAFTLFVLWALGDKSRVGSCGCFGREDTPATPVHAEFNATAAAIAAIAVFDPVSLSSFDGSVFDAVLAAVLIAIGIALSVVGLTIVPRVLAQAQGNAAPAVPEFSLDKKRTSRGAK